MYFHFGRKEFYALLFLHTVSLFFVIPSLSISPSEARILYEDNDIARYVLQGFFALFEKSDYALRLPFLLLHVVNGVLFFEVGRYFFKKEKDAFFASILFLMLPGVNSAALLVSKAGIIIFATLLFLYFYFRYGKISYLLLIAMMLIDNAFATLLLAMSVYAAANKDGRLLGFSVVLFSLSMYIHGFDTGGKPKGHFIDTLGIYAAVFSPLLFVYFFYSIYRTLIKEQKNILWFIVATAMFLSLALSFRQRIHIEDFAPFLVVGTPLLVKTFFDGYRVRLPQFRTRYKNISYLVLFSLVCNTSLLYGNKYLYYFMENPKKHFAYKLHYAKPLADALKKEGIDYVQTSDRDLQYQLKFYGITQGNQYRIEEQLFNESDQKVSILYNRQEIATFYVSKINI